MTRAEQDAVDVLERWDAGGVDVHAVVGALRGLLHHLAQCDGELAGRLDQVFGTGAAEGDPAPRAVPTAGAGKLCLHCGNAHIVPGTPADEHAQMEQCRQAEIAAMHAERAAIDEFEVHGACTGPCRRPAEGC